MDAVFSWISQYGYAGLFILLLLGIVGLPIPDETLLMFCGYLIWRGRLQPLATFLAGFGGSLCGITLSYLLGRSFGYRVAARYGRLVRLTPQRLERVHDWFGRLGSWLLTAGYFIPGVRHFTALVAGMTKHPWPLFALFAYSGAAIWVTVFLSIGYVVGDRWEQTAHLLHRYAVWSSLLAAVILALAWFIRSQRKKRQWENRRES